MYCIYENGYTEQQQKLFRQSDKVQITLLVIYGFGDGHTCIHTLTHTDSHISWYVHKSDSRNQARMPGVLKFKARNSKTFTKNNL